MSNVKLLSATLAQLADLNGTYFANNSELPASLVIAPSRAKGASAIDVMPIECLVMPETRKALRDADLSVTCLEGYLTEQPASAPWLDPETISEHPDARHCYVYLAQTRDGTRVCAVQYILKPEHSHARLSPLKILDGRTVAITDPEIADMARPGRSLQ